MPPNPLQIIAVESPPQGSLSSEPSGHVCFELVQAWLCSCSHISVLVRKASVSEVVFWLGLDGVEEARARPRGIPEGTVRASIRSVADHRQQPLSGPSWCRWGASYTPLHPSHRTHSGSVPPRELPGLEQISRPRYFCTCCSFCWNTFPHLACQQTPAPLYCLTQTPLAPEGLPELLS